MKRKSVSVGVVGLMLALLFVGAASAQEAGSTIAGGFNGPQGVLVAPDGSVWVIDSGIGGDQEIPFVNPDTGEVEPATIGETARVVQVTADGTQVVAANLTSILVGQEALGGARLALMGDTLYVTNGGWIGAASEEALPNTAAVLKIEDGEATEIAKLWPLEKEQNPDGHILESHPYGLTPGPDGKLWVADAGANTILTVDPSNGEVSLVAVLDGIPSPLPNPARGDAQESDPVPTAVAIGQDGSIYVSYLPGFPFLPGSAKVVRLSADGQATDYATGLTMITDLRAGPDGNLYAVSLGQFTEQGPVPNSGAIVRVKEGDASETILAGISFPTSIDFTPEGDAYVTTNGVGAPGSGELVRYEGVTSMAGGSTSGDAGPESIPETGGMPLGTAWIATIAGAGLVMAGLRLGWHARTRDRDSN
jgi:DNA-binding beta-propeller fold protein YncE